MKNLKYILIFLLLIIISTAGYAGWDYYNTKKIEEIEGQRKISDRLKYEQEVEPRDWSVCESEELGFKVKYPQDWEESNYCMTFKNESIGKIAPLVRIRVIEPTTGFTSEELLESHFNNPKFPWSLFGTVERVDLKEGLEEMMMLDNDTDIYAYIFEKDGRVFTFKINAPAEDYNDVVTKNGESLREVFEKMYKSFEFID